MATLPLVLLCLILPVAPLAVDAAGRLCWFDAGNGTVWSPAPNAFASAAALLLNDTGSLVYGAAWLSFNEPTDTLMPGQAIRGGNGTTTLRQRPLHAGQLRHAAARGRRRPSVRQHQQRQRSARPHRQRQARPQRRDPRSSSPPTRAPPSGCGGSRSTTTATCSSTPWCPGPGGGAWCGSSCRTAGALMQRSSLCRV